MKTEILTKATSWSSLNTKSESAIQVSRRSHEGSRFNVRYDPIIEAGEVWKANHQDTSPRYLTLRVNVQAARNDPNWSNLESMRKESSHT
jgi:hypothetical protein